MDHLWMIFSLKWDFPASHVWLPKGTLHCFKLKSRPMANHSAGSICGTKSGTCRHGSAQARWMRTLFFERKGFMDRNEDLMIYVYVYIYIYVIIYIYIIIHLWKTYIYVWIYIHTIYIYSTYCICTSYIYVKEFWFYTSGTDRGYLEGQMVLAGQLEHIGGWPFHMARGPCSHPT